MHDWAFRQSAVQQRQLNRLTSPASADEEADGAAAEQMKRTVRMAADGGWRMADVDDRGL